MVLGLASTSVPGAAASNGPDTLEVGALSHSSSGPEGGGVAPQFVGPRLPHRLFVVALRGGGGSYPPFSIPDASGAAQAAGDYWVDHSNGAIWRFDVADAKFLL